MHLKVEKLLLTGLRLNSMISNATGRSLFQYNVYKLNISNHMNTFRASHLKIQVLQAADFVSIPCEDILFWMLNKGILNRMLARPIWFESKWFYAHAIQCTVSCRLGCLCWEQMSKPLATGIVWVSFLECLHLRMSSFGCLCLNVSIWMSLHECLYSMSLLSANVKAPANCCWLKAFDWITLFASLPFNLFIISSFCGCLCLNVLI